MTIMEELKTKLDTLMSETVQLTQETLDWGFALQDAFPSKNYSSIVLDGQRYRIITQVELRPIAADE